jgi:hypothetical protein
VTGVQTCALPIWSPDAIGPLTELLLYGEKEDLHDGGTATRPEAAQGETPAAKTLVSIGMPALDPVFRTWTGIGEKTLQPQTLSRQCLTVIRGILGPELAKRYLTLRQRDFPAMQPKFEEAVRFMDELHESKSQ